MRERFHSDLEHRTDPPPVCARGEFRGKEWVATPPVLGSKSGTGERAAHGRAGRGRVRPTWVATRCEDTREGSQSSYAAKVFRPTGHKIRLSRVTPARRGIERGGWSKQMATDYDSPRKTDEDMNEDSLQELQARRVDKGTGTIDVDPDEVAEGMELPGADLSGEELAVRVLPRQADEFTCSRCFLVHHRSQLAEERRGQLVCKECA
ncbi:hypothetical protein GCM10009605_40220 [Nocardiopsis composta]